MSQISANTNRLENFTQLILIGHGGQLMWEKLHETPIASSEPIDSYSRYHVENFFSEQLATDDFELIFPALFENNVPIGLQALGEMAGWHYPSPFGIGVNDQWGSWFAYRAVVLAKSHYLPSVVSKSQSPCQSCGLKPCIKRCPAKALKGEKLDLDACISYRSQTDSNCKDCCIARMSCPVALPHQYKIEQIKYHYGRSLKTIISE